MNKQQFLELAIPAFALAAAIVAVICVKSSKGVPRSALILFFSGLACATVGAAVAVYLSNVETGATIGLFGGAISVVGVVMFFLSFWRAHHDL